MTQGDGQKFYEKDDINLRELWIVVVKRKLLILAIVFTTSIGSIGYVVFLKPVVPIYQASVLIEVGNYFTENWPIRLEDPVDLQNIISRALEVDASVPMGSSTLLLLSSSNTSEVKAKEVLQSGIDYIMQRHKEMALDYERVRMSQVIGGIEVVDIAKQPKKKLIVVVAFITGLILSVFLAFFLEFIQTCRKERVEEA